MRLFITNSITADRVVLALIGLLLIALVGFIGCSHQLTTKPDPATVVKKKKTPKKPPCKATYQKKGLYCMVIVARCRAHPDKPRVTTVTVAVLDTSDNGKRAAEESLHIMMKYFGGRPQLQLLTRGNIKGVPLFLFLVKGVLPRLP
jgi:hypothetical protein